MRRFESQDANSNKFWEVSQHDNKLNIRSGKSGTNGQSKEKEFASSEKAAAAMEKLIKEKTSKNYLETSVSPDNSAANSANPASSTAINQAQDVPPWLANGVPLALPKNYFRFALPNRRFPGPALTCRALPSWNQVRHALTRLDSICELGCDALEPEFADAWQAAKQGLQDDIAPTNRLALSILLMLERHLCSYIYTNDRETVLSEFLIAEHGLEYALEVMLESQTLTLPQSFISNRQMYTDLDADSRDTIHAVYGNPHRLFSKSLLTLRQALAHAEPAVWERCVALLKRRIPQLPVKRQVAMAVLLPDDEAWNQQLTRDLLAHTSDGKFWPLLLQVSNAQLRRQLEGDERSILHLRDNAVYCATLLQDYGLAALPMLLPYIEGKESANIIAAIGLPEAITALAKIASLGKAQQKRFTTACQRWPAASCYALAELLGNKPPDALLFSTTLASLLQQHPDLLQRLLPHLSSAATTEIERIYQGIQPQAVAVGEAQLPSILINPPWLQAKKKGHAPLQLDALALSALPELAAQFELGQAWETELSHEQERLTSLLETWRAEPEQWCSSFGVYDFAYGRNEAITREIKTKVIAAMLAQDMSALLSIRQLYMAQDARYWCRVDSRAFLIFPQKIAIEAWNRFATEDLHSIEAAIRQLGVATLPGVLSLIKKSPSEYLHLGLHFAACELAPFMASAFVKMKSMREIARTCLLKYPKHAIAGLLPQALGKSGEARECASIVLRFLASHGQQANIAEIAQQFAIASTNVLEQTTVVPATLALLDEDPLERFPSKISKAPIFWQPLMLRRPLLKGSKQALDNEAIEHLSSMLRFPSNDGVYAGIAIVKQACDAQSLADFAWDGFHQWLSAGAPAKENWAFLSLGLLGNDDTARKLDPLIRAWPGESQSARALQALEILANIGTDTALMLLHDIAQQVKSKALQEKAQEKIAQIAEQRQLKVQ